MSHGTLMYCTNSKIQNEFIKTLRNKGCKNFVFHEYTSSKILKNGYVQIFSFFFLDSWALFIDDILI